MTEPLDGLAEVLAENPDMPYAQYMVRVPGRHGLYHLTMTAPGQDAPQTLVERLGAERDVLLQRLHVNEALITSINIAITALREAAELVRTNANDRETVVDRRLTDLEETLRFVQGQQQIDVEALTKVVEVIRVSHEAGIKDLHDRLQHSLVVNVNQLRGEQETGIKELGQRLSDITFDGLRETREGVDTAVSTLRRDMEERIQSQAMAHEQQISDLQPLWLKTLSKQAAQAETATNELIKRFAAELASRTDEYNQMVAKLRQEIDDVRNQGMDRLQDHRDWANDLRDELQSQITDKASLADETLAKLSVLLTRGLEGKAGSKAFDNANRRLTQVQGDANEHAARLLHLETVVEDLRSSALVELFHERSVREAAERRLTELEAQVQGWEQVVQDAVGVADYFAGIQDVGGTISAPALVALLDSARQLDRDALAR